MTSSKADQPNPKDGVVLSVRNLHVSIPVRGGEVHAVNGVSFDLRKGETLGILGESGSGKSVMLRSIMGILPEYARQEGEIHFQGQNLLDMSRRTAKDIRGPLISMIFQDPMTAFDPVFTVGTQIIESIVRHDRCGRKTAAARALELMEMVAIPSARSRLSNFPHEMSGGMRQRAMIALALACRPKVLLADEPTTALDVTVQMQILLLLRRLQSEFKMAMVFVTHNVGVAVEMSDDIGVMYAGRIVEKAPTVSLMEDGRHPYTMGLLASTVRKRQQVGQLEAIPGAPPDLTKLPLGCAFSPRCRFSDVACARSYPAGSAVGIAHTVNCIRVASKVR